MRRPIAPAALALVAALLLAGCAGAVATQEHTLPRLALTPCRLSEHGLTPATIAAACGALAVPENRVTPGSRTIELRVVVPPSISRDGP